jgi:hypothetical protein
MLQKLTGDSMPLHRNDEPLCLESSRAWTKSLWILAVAAAMMLSACGGGASNGSQNSRSLSGNWQFTVANPTDNSFLGGLQGGFLLQNNAAVTGGAVYSVALPAQGGGVSTVCNSGSAAITGTLNGQNVSLTAVAGTQTFTFTGMLSSNGSTMAGTYTSTAGTGAGGTVCGTAQTGLQWSATSVPALTGSVAGSFHSQSGSLNNQDFPVSGFLTQGPNIGASNATVTGNLSFLDPTSLLSNYPCFDTASVNGQVSGNVVILQIIGTSGSNLGQIGGSPGSGVSAVTFDSTPQGYVLHSLVSPAYAVNTKACPGSSLNNPGDFGNICLALNATGACNQPISLTPAALIFPPQLLGSVPTSQTIVLANSNPSGAALNGLQLSFQLGTDSQFPGFSDFNGLPNFTEQDTCAASLGSTFSLTPGQSCNITISFTPQESCPWLPFGNPPSISGAAPSLCPFPLTATLTVNSPSSADNDTAFAVPITGNGVSAVQPSTAELDFGAEALSQGSLPQSLSFTNHSGQPVQILGSTPCVNPSGNGGNTLPHPLQSNSSVAGLQVVSNDVFSITPNGAGSINYRCDRDATSTLPNFQISADSCTGSLLASQASCSLQVVYAPQPNTTLTSGLDYFLELNTVQCAGGVTTDCEIDGGRFPVELRANPPSPLRMSPAAGLDFGNQLVGSTTAAQTITLFNDPADPNSATVNFVGKVVKTGNYVETDDCPFSLAPGGICTLTVTFTPKAVGFAPGTLTINYTPEPGGVPQIVRLRGTGQ